MKNIWEKEGDKQCLICGKNFAQLYSDNINGRYTTGCWKCLYKKN